MLDDLSIIEAEFGDLGAYRTAPEFWITHPDRGLPFLDTLRGVTVHTIGKSAGGLDIVAVECGRKEALDITCDNLQSCLDSGLRGGNRGDRDEVRIYPPAFFGSKRRRRPVLALQGAIHGGELSGTAASFNLLQVIETGADLRGKPWPTLRELACRTRILFIPWLNPDGTARWPLRSAGNIPSGLGQRLTQGIGKDGGTSYTYPSSKAVFPIPPEKTAYMGSYYNDNGVNLQYDVFGVEREPETQAWMRYYRAERPDAVINFHCDSGSMFHTPAAVPEGYRALALRIGAVTQQRLVREGFRNLAYSWIGMPETVPVINQNSAIWHVCGALPLLCEMPAGISAQPMSEDQIVDIGLLAIEEVLFFAHTQGLRPYENWEKMQHRLPSDEWVSES